jgi:hypothetical protein
MQCVAGSPAEFLEGSIELLTARAEEWIAEEED